MATAVLLEIDQLQGELASRAPAAGLVPLAGRPLLAHAVGALRACGNVDRVLLAGPSVYARHPAATELVDDTVLLDEPLEALAEAVLARVGEEAELLVWPTNGPLLTPAALERLFANAPLEAALCLVAVREDKVRARFGPSFEFNSHSFAGDRVAFTPLALCRPDALQAHRDLVWRLLGGDLNWTEAVKVLGMGFALKLTNGRVSLGELAARLSELFEAPCVVLILPDAELLCRVRTRDEHHAARDALEGR